MSKFTELLNGDNFIIPIDLPLFTHTTKLEKSKGKQCKIMYVYCNQWQPLIKVQNYVDRIETGFVFQGGVAGDVMRWCFAKDLKEEE